MDFVSVLMKSEPHPRTIVHLDMDCFYAQVEEIRDPSLRTQPLGIQQKNIVVTCNYVARQFGVTKLMLISEAKRLCPSLVLVTGEDLTPYRQMSQRIFEVLLNYTPTVEKLGLDENFMDVSALVEARQQQQQQRAIGCGDDDVCMGMPTVEGHVYPEGAALHECDCGCAQRLAIGTQIAKEVREELRATLGITCCAGVSYNKLLAKLVGSQHKPNQQTVLVSSYTEEFMRELAHLSRVTGIGQKTESLLLESGISNIEELQQCDMEALSKKFGFETATKLKDLAFGRDKGAVRTTGKPKTISLEDSCRPISVRTDVEERFRMLLIRLMEQVGEDGRIPVAIKVTLRKFDAQKKTSHRETKQANILPSLFKSTPCSDNGGMRVMLAEGAQEKLLKIIIRLFERIVDLSKPFNITLIGLAFSKFQQRKMGSSSIANYLIKKTDLEVQSITSLTNTSLIASPESPTPSISSTASDEAFRSSPTTFQPSDQFYRRRTAAVSPIPMLLDNGSESAATNSDFSDFSETEVEPSPKKSRIGRLLMAKRRCLAGNAVGTDASDVASPSKLRVSDLRLNSRDSEKDSPMCSSTTSSSSLSLIQRFRTIQPPSSLLSHMERRSTTTPSINITRYVSPLPSPMDETMSTPTTPVETVSLAKESEQATCVLAQPVTSTTITGNLSNIPCPANVDTQVFNELPTDVQNELIASWRSSLAAAAAAAVTNGNISPLVAAAAKVSSAKQASNTTTTTKAGGAAGVNGAQKNTLYHYFLRHK